MDKGLLPYQIITIKSREKSAEHFLTSNFSRLTFQNRPIALITLVEINDPWNPAREAAGAIIDSVSREFIKSSSNSLLTRFEQVLKNTNNIVERAQEKIDKFINVAAVIIDGEQVHFSTIGDTRIILHRSGRLADLSSEQSSASKRFSAVTSGDLNSTDTLIVATHTLASLIKDSGKDSWLDDTSEYLHNLTHDLSPESQAIVEGFFLRYAPKSPNAETFFVQPKTEKAPLASSPIRMKMPRLNIQPVVGGIQKVTKNIHVPKLKLVRLKFQFKGSGLVRSVIKSKITYLLILIAAFSYGTFLLVKSFNRDEPEIKKTTALDTLNTQTSSTIFNYLNADTTLASVNELSDSDKTAFYNKLGDFGVKTLGAELKSEAISDIVQLASLGSDIYLLDATGQIYKWNGSVLAQLAQASKIVNPASFVVFAADRIVISDTAGGIWLMDGTLQSPKTLTIPGNIPAGKKILGKYSGNLYLFTSSGAVYKFTAFDKELTSPSLVTKAGVLPFTTLLDWTINGDFAAITEAGLIQTWSKNTLGKSSFTVSGVATKAGLIIDNKDNSYIASGNILNVFASGGSRTSVYYLNDKNKITDIILDDNGNYFISAGGRLFQITL